MIKRALTQLDSTLLAWVHMLPGWLRPVMEFATLIGEPVAVGAVLAGLALVTWRQGHRTLAYASMAGIGGLLVSTVLKLLFHRTRPDTYVAVILHSYSFPSGHAAGSMIGYGLLAWLAAKHLPGPWSFLVATVLCLLILLVGISRIYLGAHYPTDVLGGWVIGGIILALIIWGFKL